MNPTLISAETVEPTQKLEVQANATAPASPTITPSLTIAPTPVVEPSKPQTPTQQALTERISSFIIVYMQKCFSRRECFTGILTSQRLFLCR